MQKLVLSIIGIISLTACHSQRSNDISSFKNTPTCQTQLKDIIYANYKLQGIARTQIEFEFHPIRHDEEIIQINLQQKKQQKPSSVGRIKVNKSENTIFNSTFDNSNLIAIKLDDHPDFVSQCF